MKLPAAPSRRLERRTAARNKRDDERRAYVLKRTKIYRPARRSCIIAFAFAGEMMTHEYSNIPPRPLIVCRFASCRATFLSLDLTLGSD